MQPYKFMQEIRLCPKAGMGSESLQALSNPVALRSSGDCVNCIVESSFGSTVEALNLDTRLTKLIGIQCY